MVGDKPLVSVLMPYYNGKRYVKEAIDSILAQTYKNIEIIVVDDASTDKESKDYITSLTNEYGIKLVFHPKNKGGAEGNATAFKNSIGDLVAITAQDDIFLPEKIEKQVDYLLSRQLDAVYTPCGTLHEPCGKIEKPDIRKIIERSKDKNLSFNCMLSNISGATAQGLLVKREVVEQSLVNIWQDFMLDDWPVNVVLWTRYKTEFMDESLALVRKHTENTSLDTWKWFAPKLEVPARLGVNIEEKIEGIGRRLLSCSIQLQKKQESEPAAIVAFAAAMLLDNPESKRKLKRALRKIPVKIRSRVAKERLNILFYGDNAAELSCNWDEFALQINTIIKSGGDIKDFGEVFFRLSQSITGEDRVRIALAGTILTGRCGVGVSPKNIDKAVEFIKGQIGLRAIFG